MPWRQRREDAGFLSIFGSETIGEELRRGKGVVSPVVVRDQDAVAVMQFENRVSQDIAKTVLSEGRPQPADSYLGRIIVPTEDETANQNVVTGLDKTARADVRQRRVGRLAIIVNFHETNAGCLAAAGKDGGVSARLKGRNND